MWALQDARLADGRVVDIRVDGERIADVSPDAAAGLADVIQCSQQLVLPAFIDGHVHLDKVKDGFYPFGRGSMLEVALISAHAAHLTNRADLAFALRAITEAPAVAMRLTDYGLRPGARADLVWLPVPTWDEAMRLQPPPSRVWCRGRLVAEGSLRSELYRTTPPGATRPSAA